jgi:hypothetical protein
VKVTVKYQIQVIAPLQAAKVLGAVFFVVTCLFLPFAALSYDLALPQGPGHLIWAFLAVPLVNALFAFFLGWVFAFAYNLVAKRLGGLEITLQERNL